MFCTKCGAQLQEGQKFCSKCGAKVEVAEEVKAEEAAAAVEAKAENAVETAEAKSEDSVEAVETKAEETADVAEAKAEEVAEVVEAKAEETTEAVEAKIEETAEAVEAKAEEAAEAVEMKAEESVEAVENKAEQAVEAVEAKAAEASVAEATPEEPKKKNSFLMGVLKNKMLWAFLAIVIIAVLLITFLINTFANPIHRMGKSNKYLKWVVEKHLDDNMEDIEALYATSLERTDLTDQKLSADVKVEVTETGSSYLALASVIGVDLTWIKDVEVSSEINAKNDMLSANAVLSSAGKQLVKAEGILDVKNQMGYVGLPDFSKYYLASSLKDMGEDLGEMMDSYKKNMGELPSGKFVGKLFKKYTSIALSAIEEDSVNVKKQKTIRSAGISQDVSMITVTVDEKLARDVAGEVCNALLEDQDVKQLVSDFADVINEMNGTSLEAEEIYNQFMQEVEYVAQNINTQTILGDDVMELMLYVDKKGNIVGMEASADDTNIKCVSASKGSDVATSISVSDGRDSFILEGDGTYKGNKLTGTYTVSYGEGDYATTYAEISVQDFDMKALRRGEYKGEITIAPSPALMNEIDLGAFNLNVRLQLDCGNKKGKVVMHLGMGESEIGSITMEYKQGKGAGVSVPSQKKTYSMQNAEELDSYLQSLNFSSLIKNLEKIGCPDSYIDSINQLETQINKGFGALLW